MAPTGPAAPPTADGSALAPDLVELIARQWPAMADRLGERRAAFVDAAARQAAKHGCGDAPVLARYLNLCFVFGPAFEEKPENEWALALLADRRLAPWVRLHQLVLRAQEELTRRGADAAALARSDAAALDALDERLLAAQHDAPRLTRRPCDLEAADLRLLEVEWRHEYRRLDGVWQRVPLGAPPPPLRIDATHPAPAALHVLAPLEGQAPAARLQVRQIPHAVCDVDRHPAVDWLHQRELGRWQGHAAKAVSWPVRTPAPPPPGNGLGSALIEQPLPALTLLRIDNCALRDSGVPIGPLQLPVLTYPAQQWMLAMQRGPGTEARWPADPKAPPEKPLPTRWRLECDGTAAEAAGWLRGFDERLPQAVAAGLGKLFEAWQKSAPQGSQRATLSVLSGRAGFTWGWREGPEGLAAAPLLRLQGEVDLGCALDLLLEGELETGGSRTRVRLAAQAQAGLQAGFSREQAEPSLLETLLPVVVRWRAPFTVEHDPVAADDGAVWLEAGPCTGGLVGEAGLRPAADGGNGWQWYFKLALEPVLLPYALHDPLLGQTRRTLALLPALDLVDWSLG